MANRYTEVPDKEAPPEIYHTMKLSKATINEIVKAIEEKLGEKVVALHVCSKPTPHICPVCGGNGMVGPGFYAHIGGDWSSTSLTPEQCRSCNGTGIVWG